MTSFINRHRIALFFMLTFVLSWFPWYAGIAPEVMTMGPSIAAFIIVLIIGGRRGFVDLVRPFLRWRASLGVWGIAVLGTAVLYLIGLGVHLILGGEAPSFFMLREELNLIPLYLVVVVLMPWNGPIGEEFGWRGFALSRLQSKFGPLAASLIIGTIWGIWHLPSFFAPQDVIGAITATIGMGFLIPYTLGTIANAIFMTWLYNKSKGSALIAGIVWHAAINFWAPILLSDSSLAAAQEGTQLPTIAPALYLTVLAVQVVAAIVLTITTKGMLGYSDQQILEKTKPATWVSPNLLVIATAFLFIGQACSFSNEAVSTLEPPSTVVTGTSLAMPAPVTAQPSPVPATPTTNVLEPTVPPVYTPPIGFKEYRDADAGVSLFIPDNWVVTFVDPGRLAIFQSYPEDKYAGGEGLQPGDTKCDLTFWPDTDIAELLQQWKSDPNATVMSEQEVILTSGQLGTRLEIENRGHSLSLITEVNNQAVTLVCFGEFAPFDDIAVTLHEN
ncbi:CPBP family intramembrane glutamic endopeptidase [Candidatus Leptofilum sp.]|uniref:CPBP family intramembrane glutamic endopeptidase n=1 Tax=Candidatus Leptofilum sp. TaxID=3241576 RepID=UPI003B59FDB9